MFDYRTVAPAHQIYRFCPLCSDTLQDEDDTVDNRVRPTCRACGWVYRPINPPGVIIVVETDSGIVLLHPPGGPADAPASLPGGMVEYAETPEEATIRVALQQTGLTVEPVGELIRFLQRGTPFGPALMFGFTARAVGGTLLADGAEGPAAVYPVNAMPAIIPVRVANQRVLDAYLNGRPA
jgi:NADH pyrophosphatase NudC (nudix superfamily)